MPLYLGALGELCGELRGELSGDIFLGGTGGGNSRRVMLGDIRGEPLTGLCLAWSERDGDNASDCRLLDVNHCDGSWNKCKVKLSNP